VCAIDEDARQCWQQSIGNTHEINQRGTPDMARYQIKLVQKFHLSMAAIVVLASASASLAQTTTYVTDTDASGNWNSAANWTNGVPNAVDAEAILNQPITTGVIGVKYTLSLGGGTDTIGKLTSNNNPSDPGQYLRTEITNGTLIFQSTSGAAELNENLGAAEQLESRLRITANVQLNSNLVVNQNNSLSKNTNTEITGRIDGDASKTITKQGLGNLQLGMSTSTDLGPTEGFFGNLLINEGAVRMIIANNQPAGTFNPALSHAAGVSVADGAQLQFGNALPFVELGPGGVLHLEGAGKPASTPTITNEGALRFDGAGEVTCDFRSIVELGTVQPSVHVAVADASSTGVFSNVVRGGGKLQKMGSGLLKLSGANTYTGGTLIGNGALAVNNSTGSGVGTGDIVMNAGSVLGGTGFIGAAADPSSVTVNGGTLSPGDLTSTLGATETPQLPNLFTSPGVLSIFGDLTLNPQSTVQLDLTGATLGAEYDQIVSNGAITLGGGTLNFSLGSFIPAGNETFTLINNTSAGAISGEFGNYSQGAAVDLAGQTFYINYFGGNGNDVVLAPNPPVLENADFNGDGQVDGADFLVWQRNATGSGGPTQGDANGDGSVNATDLAIWKAHFGGTSGVAAAAAVPEPAAATLALATLAGLLGVRSRRTS
jgi:autotransporter-associated beta strand protein